MGHVPRRQRERVTFAYDSAGRVWATSVGSPPGTTTFYFDDRGLLVRADDALGNTIRLAYDQQYNLVGITDPAGYNTPQKLGARLRWVRHLSRYKIQETNHAKQTKAV